MGVSPQGHEHIDRRSLALHHAVAEKLRAQPSLIGIARENLERWAATAGRSAPYPDEWRRILDGPLEGVLRMIEQEGERIALCGNVLRLRVCLSQESAGRYTRASNVPGLGVGQGHSRDVRNDADALTTGR